MTDSRSPKQILHEEQLILAFVLPARRRRYIEKLGNPRRRREVTDALAHFPHLDMRYAMAVPPTKSIPGGMLALFKSKGAPDSCAVISEDGDLDGKQMSLADALDAVVGRGMGTFLSCIPGMLGYFEDEDGRWILQRADQSNRKTARE